MVLIDAITAIDIRSVPLALNILTICLTLPNCLPDTHNVQVDKNMWVTAWQCFKILPSISLHCRGEKVLAHVGRLLFAADVCKADCSVERR